MLRPFRIIRPRHDKNFARDLQTELMETAAVTIEASFALAAGYVNAKLRPVRALVELPTATNKRRNSRCLRAFLIKL